MVDQLTSQMVEEVVKGEESEEKRRGIEEVVRRKIKEKKIYDWNVETVKKIISGQGEGMKKAD